MARARCYLLSLSIGHSLKSLTWTMTMMRMISVIFLKQSLLPNRPIAIEIQSTYPRWGNLEFNLPNLMIFGKRWRRNYPGATHLNTKLNAISTGQVSMWTATGTYRSQKSTRASRMSSNCRCCSQPSQCLWGRIWRLKLSQRPRHRTAMTTLQRGKSSGTYSSICVSTTSSLSLSTK